MKKILKENAVFIIFCFIMIILNLMLVSILNYDNIIRQVKYDKDVEMNIKPELEYYQMLDNKSKIENSEEFTKSTTRIIVIPSIIFIVIFLLLDTEKISREQVFLLVMIPISLLYTFVFPIGGVPDENAHWYRAYEISKGHLISEKNNDGYGGRVLSNKLSSVLTYDYKSGAEENLNYIFEDSYKDWKVRYNESLGKEEIEEFVEFSNTALYPAICYMPQAFGIVVSRFFTNSLMVQAYSARIFNLSLYIFVMWYAIKKLPFKKMAMLLIAFLPIGIQEAASMSIDGMLMAFSTLLISYTLYLKYDKEGKLNVKDYIILIIASIFTAITKIVYLPLCLIIYMIPKERFKSNKSKYIILTAIFLFVSLLDLTVIVGSLGYNNSIASLEANTLKQLKNILTRPVQFVLVILATIKKFGIELSLSMFGNGLSWLDVNISPIYVISLILITLYYFVLDNKENDKISNTTKIFSIILSFLIIAAIIVTEYLTITAYGYFYILGIQGRYFLPILILISIAFSNSMIVKKNKNIPIKYLIMFLIFINLHALTYVMYKYL